jgi:hypothetical protein
MRTCQTGTNEGSSASQEEVLPDLNGQSFIKGIEMREKSPTVIDGVGEHGVPCIKCTNIYIVLNFFSLLNIFVSSEPVPSYRVKDQIVKHDLLSQAMTA